MIEIRPFGTLPDGDEARLFRLSSDELEVRVTDLGATLVGIDAPDREGVRADVLLGYDSATAYRPNTPCFFGATVGPSANRVEGGRVPIGGRIYHLPVNENGNNLHTDHEHGLHTLVWDGDASGDGRTVTFRTSIGDGAYGLPGKRDFTVRYSLEGAELIVDYLVETDADTFVNLTNHSYFNLAGEGSGDILGQELEIEADAFVAIGKGSIPTGELRAVAGGPFDFRKAKPLGRDIDADDEQIRAGAGYDHCFCINGWEEPSPRDLPAPRIAVRALDPESGRGMELRTTLPGVQLYTGNFVDEANGKGGRRYGARSGFALEPEYYPATPSNRQFPQAIFGPESPYRARNVYRFFIS